MARLHDDELDIDDAVVRRLLADSAPHLADLPITPLPASGSSNRLFRVGTELLARLPRQPGGSASIAKEARWGPMIGGGLSVDVPEIVLVGEPAVGYPEHWSVVRWIEGRTPDTVTGADLARLVTELRAVPVPADAAADPALSWYRSWPLERFTDDFGHWLARCRLIEGLDLDLDRAAAVWEMATATAVAPAPPSWVHGDLLAENLLVRDGRIVAVLDLGGLSIGDPTVDLIAAWELLDAGERSVFRATLGIDDATWARARGWALFVALMTFPYYGRSMPERCERRRTMAAAALHDAEP